MSEENISVLENIQKDITEIKIALLGSLTTGQSGLIQDVAEIKKWRSTINKTVLGILSTIFAYALIKLLPLILKLIR